MTGAIVLFVAPVLAGVAIGYAGRGRLSALAGRLRALWLLWLAALVQAAQFSLDGDQARVPLLVVVYATVLAWVALNVRHWPPVARIAAGVTLIGALLNAAAIAANGRMPYSPQAAAQVGLPAAAVTPKNAPAGDGTVLGFLGDAIPIAPLHKLVSLGDILIAAGAAALVAVLMRPHRRKEVNDNAYE
jgi:Family of unknown function (DUF5317)